MVAPVQNPTVMEYFKPAVDAWYLLPLLGGCGITIA